MSAPELTVVVVAPDRAAAIRPTLAGLDAQTVASRLEVLIAAASADQIDTNWLRASSFAAFRIIETGPLTRRAAAAAVAVNQAIAPVVSLLENHCIPEPTWAEALLDAHRGEWAGVGPRVENANPGSATSRVTFWLSYGSMSGEQEGGTRTLLPWHNTSYRRELLTRYGEDLDELLDMEGLLQADVIAGGGELFLASEACVHHVNVSKFSSALGVHFQRGRTLGGWNAQRRRMVWWQRGLAAAATPLISVLRLRDIESELRRASSNGDPDSRPAWRAMLADGPTLAALLVALVVGEVTGYLAGTGDALERLETFELAREQHLTARDRRILFGDG